MRPLTSRSRYVLVTAAHNEEAFIEKILFSVTSQTLQPEKWVIVNDGSRDKTADIVQRYARDHSFIQLIELAESHPPDFGAQVRAINVGCEALKTGNIKFDFIGNLDADISFDAAYFWELLEKFDADPSLGLAGGWLYEKGNGEFRPRKGNRPWAVPHGIQLFRVACFQAVGGYIQLRYGAPDWCAEITARMNGWRVQSFPGLRVFHHRSTGNSSGQLEYSYRAGLAAFALGSHPAYELAKGFAHVADRPYVVGALSRLAGFIAGYVRKEARQVSPEFVRFFRREELNRLSAVPMTLIRLISTATRVDHKRGKKGVLMAVGPQTPVSNRSGRQRSEPSH